jgi:pimeloyl-ACP methyl ester carboxylesterase
VPGRRIGISSAKASTTSWPPYCRIALRLDHAGRDADRADAVARPLEGDPGGEGLERAARHRRRHDLRDPAPRAEPEEGDEAAALRDHPALGHACRDVPRGVDVEPVDRSQALERRVFESGGELTARVVDQDVHAVGALGDRVEERDDLFGLSNVTGLLKAPVADLVRDGRERLRTPTADRDGPSGVDDRPGGRGADPGAPARHDREAAFERVGGKRPTEALYHGASMQEGRVVGADGVWLATRTWSGRADGPAFVLASRTRVEPAHLGPDGSRPSRATGDRRHVRRARSRRERQAVERLRLRPHGRRRGGGAQVARRRKPILVGHSWGAMVALEVAAQKPRACRASCLIDGGVGSMRDGFASWAEAREALAPPQLAGMPADEFRAMIPRFFGDAVDVTPQIVDIVMSVMRVDAAGRIRPRLTRANHMRILRAIWEQDPVAMHARLRVPALAILAASAAIPTGTRANARASRRCARPAPPPRSSWIDGIHDLPLQHPRELVRRIRAFARTAVR